MGYGYRLAKESDHGLVVDYWVDSYRTSHAAGLIAMEDWRTVMEVQVEKVLGRPGVEVWVAYDPDEESTLVDVFGWIAVEREYTVPRRIRKNGKWETVFSESTVPLVHYISVKKPYRGFGLARGLFKAARIDPQSEFLYSCKTGVVSKLAQKIPKAKWSPLIARYPKN